MIARIRRVTRESLPRGYLDPPTVPRELRLRVGQGGDVWRWHGLWGKWVRIRPHVHGASGRYRGTLSIHVQVGGRGGEIRVFGVARLVLETFGLPAPPGYVAWYRDGDITNCRLDNLYWASPREKGLRLEGKRGLVLSPPLVRWMRARRREGRTVASIAAAAGVSYSSAEHAILGKRWGHIPGALTAERSGSIGRRNARAPLGEDNGAASLDRPKVLRIAARLRAGESPRLIARDFGVARSTIEDIRDGVTWRHVTGLDPRG